MIWHGVVFETLPEQRERWIPPLFGAQTQPRFLARTEGGTQEILLSEVYNFQVVTFRTGLIVCQPCGHTELKFRQYLAPISRPRWRQMGAITIVAASDDTSIVVPWGNDVDEPYLWTPSNLNDVRNFAVALRSLSDKTIYVTFDDNVAPAPDSPSFADSIGDAQNWARRHCDYQHHRSRSRW